MSDVVFNFSSQWSSIQVAKVVSNPDTVGESASYPYIKKIPHSLGYPPLCLGFGISTGGSSYNIMAGVDVDENYVYVEDYGGAGRPLLDCLVIYAVDISQPFSYTNYENKVGTIVPDTSGGTLDLRNFLLHSRAVSPMLLAVATKDYTSSDLTFTYTSPLDYATFSFGYLKISYNPGFYIVGTWKFAPLSGQAFPVMNTTGFVSTLNSSMAGANLIANKGTIITLRNPEIVTNNTVSVTV